MRHYIYNKLRGVKLSSAAYADYAIAGLLVPVAFLYGKTYESIALVAIAVMFNLIARKCRRFGY